MVAEGPEANAAVWERSGDGNMMVMEEVERSEPTGGSGWADLTGPVQRLCRV